jgi:DNA invertase Pin-like site-specific DNA recombinase
MAALTQMVLEVKRERITDSVAKRKAVGNNRGGRRRTFTDSQLRNALRLIDGGELTTQVARDQGMSRATLYRRIRESPVGGRLRGHPILQAAKHCTAVTYWNL